GPPGDGSPTFIHISHPCTPSGLARLVGVNSSTNAIVCRKRWLVSIEGSVSNSAHQPDRPSRRECYRGGFSGCRRSREYFQPSGARERVLVPMAKDGANFDWQSDKRPPRTD